jgi:anti-anti-sigma factor
MPVSTSLSASSLNESAGARSPIASLATGGFVILTLVALAPLFSDLPKAVLGAVIIDAVVFGMIDLPAFDRLYRVKRFDFWVAVVAVVGVLSAGVLMGVVVGITLSIIWLVYVATSPGMPLMGREAGTHVFRDTDAHPGDETFPGLAVLRLDGGLFFATAEALDERIREVALGADPPLRAVVLDLEGTDYVDSQGAAKLGEILDFLDSTGTDLRLAHLQPRVRVVLDRDGVLGRIGADRIHRDVHYAVEAQLASDD